MAVSLLAEMGACLCRYPLVLSIGAQYLAYFSGNIECNLDCLMNRGTAVETVQCQVLKFCKAVIIFNNLTKALVKDKT